MLDQFGQGHALAMSLNMPGLTAGGPIEGFAHPQQRIHLQVQRVKPPHPIAKRGDLRAGAPNPGWVHANSARRARSMSPRITDRLIAPCAHTSLDSRPQNPEKRYRAAGSPGSSPGGQGADQGRRVRQCSRPQNCGPPRLAAAPPCGNISPPRPGPDWSRP